jgi:hypothetical protein
MPRPLVKLFRCLFDCGEKPALFNRKAGCYCAGKTSGLARQFTQLLWRSSAHLYLYSCSIVDRSNSSQSRNCKYHFCSPPAT